MDELGFYALDTATKSKCLRIDADVPEAIEWYPCEREKRIANIAKRVEMQGGPWKKAKPPCGPVGRKL